MTATTAVSGPRLHTTVAHWAYRVRKRSERPKRPRKPTMDGLLGNESNNKRKVEEIAHERKPVKQTLRHWPPGH